MKFVGWMCPIHRYVMAPPKPAGHMATASELCAWPLDHWVPLYEGPEPEEQP